MPVLPSLEPVIKRILDSTYKMDFQWPEWPEGTFNDLEQKHDKFVQIRGAGAKYSVIQASTV